MGRENQGLVTMIWIISALFIVLLVAGYIAGKA